MLNLIGEGIAKGTKKALQETAEDVGEKAASKVAKKAAKKTRSEMAADMSRELVERYGEKGRGLYNMYSDGKKNSTLGKILSGEETQNPLLMYHSVDSQKLMELMHKVGDKLPNPSIQVVDPYKNVGGNFGDVILLGNKNMAYPAGRYGGIDTTTKTNIYGRDIYSKRRPALKLGTDGHFYIDGTRKIATPENISQYMNKGAVRGSEGIATAGAVAAQVTPQFKNLAEVIENAGRLQTKDVVKRSNDEWTDAVLAAIDNMKDAQDLPVNVSYNDYMQGIQDLLGNKTAVKSGFTRLPEWARGLYDNDTAREELVKLAEMGRELPTDYFELKANRPIDIREFSGAIVPEDFGNTEWIPREKEILDFFEQNNIPVVGRYFVGADGSSDRSKEAIFKKLTQQDRLKTPYLLGLGTLLGGGAMLGYNNKKKEG